MALNYIWIFFFLIAFVIGLVKMVFLGDTQVFPQMVNSTFEMAKSGFEISLGLAGVLTLWSGIMKIGEKGGIVNIVSKLIGPFFQQALSGTWKKPSCLRPHDDEFRGKYARA